MPPASRNHRTPTAADTPASPAASSLDTPRAIAAQNRWRCSRRATGGRPGDRIRGRPARSAARRRTAPIATLLHEVLRRPIDFAQYVALAFGRHLRTAGIAQSMGSKGDCFDNAAIESYHATLEKELLRGRSFRTRQEARTAIFDWIEAWYNRERRHSRLGYRSPEQFERDHERSDCVREDETIFIEQQARAA